MSAVINPNSRAATSLGQEAKLEVIQKVEGQLGRILGIHLLGSSSTSTNDNEEDGVEGFITINEDRTLRVILRRDSGQYWPSVIQDLHQLPTKLHCNEELRSLYVGLISGGVVEFALAEDLNTLQQRRQWQPHNSAITGIASAGFLPSTTISSSSSSSGSQQQTSPAGKQIFTCSKDRTLVWHCAETASRQGNYVIDSACTALQCDAAAKFVFVGASSGSIYVLRIVGTAQAQLVSKLSAHTGGITDLAWEPAKQLLFSASSDSLVIMWDIGGCRGQCYELNGHASRVTRLALAKTTRRLFSADETGHMMCWDLKATRIVAPAWRDSDKCELCDAPFFWNLKVMWDRKVVGCRRHHCRTCGASVCGPCCSHFTVFPAMGFERQARICKTCHGKMEKYPEQFDLTPLAVPCELRQGLMEMQLNEAKAKLVTVGYDRIIIVWNVAKML